MFLFDWRNPFARVLVQNFFFVTFQQILRASGLLDHLAVFTMG
jgi:hypothetical protein